MRVAFDIGGVLSKYPKQMETLARHFAHHSVYVITDMHDKAEVLRTLKANGFGFIPEENIHCADYKTHGEFCKAVILRDLKIDIFIDDFVGYCQWDSSFGPAPIRLLVAPDGFRPYWHENWKVAGAEQEFGRRVYKKEN